jgi:hypothetical protein
VEPKNKFSLLRKVLGAIGLSEVVKVYQSLKRLPDD